MVKLAKKKKESIITSEHKVNKEFFYAQDDITLKFTLRVDKKDELLIFRDLLVKAFQDIDLELKRLSL